MRSGRLLRGEGVRSGYLRAEDLLPEALPQGPDLPSEDLLPEDLLRSGRLLRSEALRSGRLL